MELNTLLESANSYKSLQADAARLADKWTQSGLLEGMFEIGSTSRHDFHRHYPLLSSYIAGVESCQQNDKQLAA